MVERFIQRMVRFVVAPLVILGGLWCLLFVFAFAKLGDPDNLWGWKDYVSHIASGGGIPVIGIGLLMILGGLYLAAGPRRGDGKG
jgi:hypothetical protein